MCIYIYIMSGLHGPQVSPSNHMSSWGGGVAPKTYHIYYNLMNANSVDPGIPSFRTINRFLRKLAAS